MVALTLTRADLAQFTGSTEWFRHPLNQQVVFTEGARHLAEAGGAYWLLDEIALAQQHIPAVAAEPFQAWQLSVWPNRSAKLTCGDGNRHTVFSKAIPYTDFPLVSVDLYFIDNTILLPSEY